MQAGDFDKKIIVQKFDAVEGKWMNVCSLWAAIKTIKSDEIYNSNAFNGLKIRFITRFTPKINENMRILHRNEPFKISSIVNDSMKNQTLTIHVYEMALNDECELVTLSQEVDGLGQRVGMGNKRLCPCSRSEIVQEESSSGQTSKTNGNLYKKNKIMVIVESMNYSDEKSLFYKGQKYKIYKVVDRLDGYTELYCEVRTGG